MEQDLVLQGRGDQLEELVQILLNLGCFVNVLEVTQHIILHLLWKSEGAHRLLNHIQLILECLLPLVDGRHQCCHVTENETSDNGTEDDDDSGEEGLTKADRAAVIALDEQHLIIEDRIILVPLGVVIKLCMKEVDILRRYPQVVLLVPDQHIPDTSQPVDK